MMSYGCSPEVASSSVGERWAKLQNGHNNHKCTEIWKHLEFKIFLCTIENKINRTQSCMRGSVAEKYRGYLSILLVNLIQYNIRITCMDTQQISHQNQSSIETRNTFRRNPQSYTCWFSIHVLFIEPLNFWLDTFSHRKFNYFKNLVHGSF